MEPSTQPSGWIFAFFFFGVFFSGGITISFYLNWVSPQFLRMQGQIDQIQNYLARAEAAKAADKRRELLESSEFELRLEGLGFSLTTPDPTVLLKSYWFEEQGGIVVVQPGRPEENWIGCECCGSAHSIRSVIGTENSPEKGLYGLFCLNCGRGLRVGKDDQYEEADLSKELPSWESQKLAQAAAVSRAPSLEDGAFLYCGIDNIACLD